MQPAAYQKGLDPIIVSEGTSDAGKLVRLGPDGVFGKGK